MKSKLKRALSFLMVVCLLFTTLWTVAIVASAEGEVWEETYYGTPIDYYAGGSKSISTSDSSFSDWAGQDLIEIDSLANPENWQAATFTDEITFRYALAWDTTNLYFYIEIDEVMTNLVTTAPRFWYDITPASTARTGLIDFGYDATAETMIVKRADRFALTNDATFKAAIGVYAEEVDGTTYIEASIPWANMNEAFTPAADAVIGYNVGVLTGTSTTSLYAADTAPWHVPAGNANAPWTNSTKYLEMHFATGTAVLPEITPKALTTSAIVTSFAQETNMALGKTYTGTAGTRAGWIDAGTLLTNGVYGTFETISGTVFAGWQGGGIGVNAGTLTPDVEADGKIVKTIDLGSVVEGMHKFVASSGQVAAFGISFPDDVTFYASANGLHYQLLGSGVVQDYVSGLNGGQTKETQNYVVTLDAGVAARYIKVVITPPEGDYVITPIGEIAAIKNVSLPSGDVSIGNVNAYWLSAEMAATDNGIGGTYVVGQLANIYTVPGATLKSLCGGDYLTWWHVGVFEWDEEFGAYELTAKYPVVDGSGAAKGALVVPENGFIVTTNGGMNALGGEHLLFVAQTVGVYGYLYGSATVGQSIEALSPQTNLIGKMKLSMITEVPNAYSPVTVKYNDDIVVPDAAFGGANVAEGKTYTAVASGSDPLAQVGFGGNYLDDGIKLTSGTVSTAYNVDTVGFYRAQTGLVEVNLGEAYTLSAFKMAFWQQTGYGIAGPSGITVSVSDDGVNWSYLGAMSHTKAEGLTYATLMLPSTITVQYVRYSVNCNNQTFVFASEVMAIEYNPEIVPIELNFFLTHFNATEEGAGVIFNSSYGATVNTAWWNLVQFTWNEAGYYQVTATDFRGNSGQTAPMAIPENGFVYGINTGNNYPALVAQGHTQYTGLPDYTSPAATLMMSTTVKQFVVGDKVYFYGFDAEYEVIFDGSDNGETPWYDDNFVCNTKAVLKTPKTAVQEVLGDYAQPHRKFSITNMNAYITTGTTSIYTSTTTSSARNFRWSAVYVFAPTEFEGLYELYGAGVNLLTDPNVTVTVPTGGFAIGINNALHSSGVDSRLFYSYASTNWVPAVSTNKSTAFLSNNINYADMQLDGTYTGVYISLEDISIANTSIGTTAPAAVVDFRYLDYGFEDSLIGTYTAIDINFTTEWAAGNALLTNSVKGESMTLGELTGNNYWYWHLATCEWSDAEGAYVVTTKYNLFEDHTNVAIPVGGFVIAVHSASASFSAFGGLTQGSKVYLYNVDPLYAKPGDTFTDAYFTFSLPDEEATTEPSTPIAKAKKTVTNNNAWLADVVTLLTRVEGNAATTIGEISAIFEGSPEDYNYFYLAVVEWNSANARYQITAKYDTLGRPAGDKTNVVVPANGFIIAVHGGASGAAAFASGTSVGDAVYLYTDATDYAIIDSGARDTLANTYFTVGKYDYLATSKYYVPDADMTAINSAIDQVRGLNEADYTEESWAAFIEALEGYYLGLGGLLPEILENGVGTGVFEPMTLQKLVDLIDANGFDAEKQTLLDDAALDITLAKGGLELSVILGDLDGNGEFTANDIILALQGNAGLISLTAEQLAAFDVDGNGLAEANDIILMFQMDAGIITAWPTSIA